MQELQRASSRVFRLVQFDNYCRFGPAAQQAPQVKRGEHEFGRTLVKTWKNFGGPQFKRLYELIIFPKYQHSVFFFIRLIALSFPFVADQVIKERLVVRYPRQLNVSEFIGSILYPDQFARFSRHCSRPLKFFPFVQSHSADARSLSRSRVVLRIGLKLKYKRIDGPFFTHLPLLKFTLKPLYNVVQRTI